METTSMKTTGKINPKVDQNSMTEYIEKNNKEPTIF
jgi:hypothetical protein